MHPNITVAALGPGDPGLLTLQTADVLKKAGCLILRTGRHGCSSWLNENHIAFETLDALYDAYEDFDEMHQAMAKALWKKAAETPVVFAVADPASDGAVAALASSVPADAHLKVLPGVSVADACLAALPLIKRSQAGTRILPAMDCDTASPDPCMPLMITEIDNRALAGDVKLWLTDLYPDEMQAVFFVPSEKAERKAILIPLEDLDRQKHYDHTTCLYLPAVPLADRERFCFRDLCDIMEILRGEDGCPWDREQTHETLRKYLIEEAWETVGAIDDKDPDHIADELGDVLLQIVFHASIGRQHGAFSISDVTSDICRKMIYRHAHIFGSDRCDTPEAVSENWEKLKKAEKGLTTQSSVLADVSLGLPALMRAAKVQKKAKQVGFDWDTAEEALPKIHEESDEVLEELKNGRDPSEELGDLLFACVNVARLCGTEPELLLKAATDKFIRRFTAMESLIISERRSFEGLTLSEMDVYWNTVKTAEKQAR